jgi:hypothetical protein
LRSQSKDFGESSTESNFVPLGHSRSIISCELAIERTATLSWKSFTDGNVIANQTFRLSNPAHKVKLAWQKVSR